MIKLSILIPSLDKRVGLLAALLRSIERQMVDGVELVVSVDNGKKSIGEKRNQMTADAKGLYVASIDDDDHISPDYIQRLMDGIDTGADCCSLVGVYTVNGRLPKVFKHSIEYDGWYEKGNILYRYPNHLNCIKAS